MTYVTNALTCKITYFCLILRFFDSPNLF
jgi:hypothetical protein